MRELSILAGSAFVLAIILTPLLRNVFSRIGVVDRPDNKRKLHTKPVPHMGGVPLVFAYVLSFFVLAASGQTKSVDFDLLLRVALPAAVIFTLGILDDWRGLSPLPKLGAQMIAGVWVFMEGVRVTGVAGHQLPVWLSLPITVLWVLACTNAFNLIDGMDGLAAGVGLFATTTILIAALMQRNLALAAVTAPLVGALIGFLRYNFNPATIFLGDSGSLVIGFLLGCFGVVWSQKSATILGMTAPLMALSIPILDVLLSIVRRFLRGQPIMAGDRGHIHHRLLQRGLSPRKAVLLLYGFAGIAAVLSIFQSVSGRYAGTVLLVFAAVAWMGIQNLGYTEFDQARRMILAGGFRRSLNSQLALRSLHDALASSKTRENSWEILKESAKEFGFAEIRWEFGDSQYAETLAHVPRDSAWELRIALSAPESITLRCATDATPMALDLANLAESIRSTLGPTEVQAVEKPEERAIERSQQRIPPIPMIQAES
jgi:UDP-GlcNAc:undecaprenyl-phosphate/decaprenyl-phosphate GlcNAc-1-phosphate transferase